MIRRNTASQVIHLPALLLTADGAAVTSGASLSVVKDGSSAASAGTLTHVAGGVWSYTLTQSETDAAIVALILTATDATAVVVNLVTTAADTSSTAFGANTTTPPTAAAIRSEIDSNSTQLAAIVVDTGTTLPATLSGIETKVDTIDGIVNDILVDTGTTLPATLTTIDTEVGQVLDRAGYTVAVLTGAISNADTSTNTFAVTIDGVTYTVTNNGIGTDGDRTAPTLAKA